MGSRILEVASREDNDLAVSVQEHEYERGSCIGSTHGTSTDSIFRDMEREDMLREVSKLPPSERKAALKVLRRKAREENK